MNSAAVDNCLEVREAIDLALVRAPVVLDPPVIDQFLQVGEVGSILPSSIRHFAGKASVLEPRIQIGEDLIANVDFTWFDIGHRSTPAPIGPYNNPAPVAARVLPSRLNASITWRAICVMWTSSAPSTRRAERA